MRSTGCLCDVSSTPKDSKEKKQLNSKHKVNDNFHEDCQNDDNSEHERRIRNHHHTIDNQDESLLGRFLQAHSLELTGLRALLAATARYSRCSRTHTMAVQACALCCPVVCPLVLFPALFPFLVSVLLDEGGPETREGCVYEEMSLLSN